MLAVKVKFTSGLFKIYDNLDPDDSNFTNNLLTIKIGPTVGGGESSVVRIPIVNVMYFEVVNNVDGVTVEGEGKVVG
jgi:hypothetical protein